MLAIAAQVRRRDGAMPRSAVVPAAGLAVLLLWIGWQARRSPLFHAYDHWAESTRTTQTYLAALAERIEAAPRGSVLVFPPPPIETKKVATEPRAMILQTYSVQAWADLLYPNRRIAVRTPTHRPLPTGEPVDLLIELAPGARTAHPDAPRRRRP